jgi:hypothetical protein
MGLFGTKKDDRPATGAAGVIEVEGSRAPTSQVRGADVSASSPPGHLGIDHAIELIRSLPTDKNVDLVVKVLKTTLESLGIRVAEIVLDAAQRQKDIQTRVGQLKSERSPCSRRRSSNAHRRSGASRRPTPRRRRCGATSRTRLRPFRSTTRTSRAAAE